MQTSELSVITKASPSRVPIKPKKKMTLIIGAVLGVMLGMGGTFFLEYMDNSLRKKEDIERWLGLPMIGAIPRIPLAKNKKKTTPTSTNISGETPPAESVEEEESPYPHLDSPTQSTQSNAQTEKSTKRKHRRGYYKQIDSLVLRSLPYLSKNFSESYLSLMTAIQFSEVDTPITTILVTSSVPGEGKTLTAANLAATYAQNGKKTLLVDLDLRRPRQHMLFSQGKKEPGFSDYFVPLALPQGESGNGLIREEINTPNLHLLTSGQIPPNPVALLGSERMSALLEEWNKAYDIIIFDSPPVLSVADATIIAQNVDITLLLVECGKTKRQLAMQAKELLEQAGVVISGVILNNIDLSKHYGGYNYLYYRY